MVAIAENKRFNKEKEQEKIENEDKDLKIIDKIPNNTSELMVITKILVIMVFRPLMARTKTLKKKIRTLVMIHIICGKKQ